MEKNQTIYLTNWATNGPYTRFTTKWDTFRADFSYFFFRTRITVILFDEKKSNKCYLSNFASGLGGGGGWTIVKFFGGRSLSMIGQPVQMNIERSRLEKIWRFFRNNIMIIFALKKLEKWNTNEHDLMLTRQSSITC